MKRLLGFAIALIVLMSITGIAIPQQSITDHFNNRGFRKPDIWKKHIGERFTNTDTPSIIDWSYAGYMRGEEAIPDRIGPIFNIVDYGAIPNDGHSDTQAFRDVLAAVTSGSVIYLPQGQFDIFLATDADRSKLQLYKGKNNITIRGAGADGAKGNGTTINVRAPTEGNFFEFKWRHGGRSQGIKTTVVGHTPRGSTWFDVVNASILAGRKYVSIEGSDLTDELTWATQVGRPKTDMSETWTNISNGLTVSEIHEIDRIDGNRIYIKSQLTTHLNSDFTASWINPNEDIGWEDIHFKGNQSNTFQHTADYERQHYHGPSMSGGVHCWMRRCRFTNFLGGPKTSGGSYCSLIQLIFDGLRGHHSLSAGRSTYNFVGLVEDHSNQGSFHGISTASGSTGLVVWGVGGPTMKGPDTHSSQPRWSLFDNLEATNHSTSGGSIENMPHHLIGYVKWNNTVKTTDSFDYWNPTGREGWGGGVTRPYLIGYVQNAGGSKPEDVYMEAFGEYVTPQSLYVAQLQRRLGSVPAWVNDIKSEFDTWRNLVLNVPDNASPVFSRAIIELSINENISVGTPLGDPIIAYDIDSTNLAYSLTGINANDFTYDSSTGQLRTKSALDFETKETYIVICNASDGARSSNITVKINVIDLSDNNPVFNEGKSTIRSIVENTASSTNIGEPVTATDADAIDTLTYWLGSLVDTTDADHFDIDSDTGQVKTKSALDFETKETYKVVVTASDGTLSRSIVVTINITDISDAAPVFSEGASTTRSVNERVVVGTNVGEPVSATDADAGETIVYSLDSGSDAGWFTIDKNTGQIKVKFAKLLHSEKAVRNVTVTASDGVLSTSIAVAITIVDVVELNTITFDEGGTITRSVAEDASIGSNVGIPITATDSEGDELSYSLPIRELNGAPFAIDSNGQITTTGVLDYETTSSYTVKIRASDDINSFKDSVLVINVTDVRDGYYISTRTLQVENAIVAALPNIDAPADVTAEDIATITTLDLSQKSITSLKSGDFDDFSSLIYLDLYNFGKSSRNRNSISELPIDIFQGLSKTQHIRLEYNDLSELPEGLFDGLTTLRSINLHGNNFTSLPYKTFKGLENCVQTIYLSENQISNINTKAFSGLNQLALLKLDQNNLSSIDKYWFKGLSKLYSVDLSRNELTDLSYLLFRDAKLLQYVYLYDNNFEEVPSGLFRRNKELQAVYLHNNELTELPDNFLKGLKKLRILQLQGNSVDPVLLDVELEKISRGKIKAVIPVGAPFDIEIPLIIENGSGTSDNITIEKGTIESDTMTITVTAGTTDAVTVDIGELPTPPYIVQGRTSILHRGYRLAKSGKTSFTIINDEGNRASAANTPKETMLLNNFPNPFNPDTWIPYQLARTSNLSITIYDIRGNVVRELALGHQMAGYYIGRSRAAYWDGRNKTGERVSSGVYFYRFKTDDMSTVRKMIILK